MRAIMSCLFFLMVVLLAASTVAGATMKNASPLSTEGVWNCTDDFINIFVRDTAQNIASLGFDLGGASTSALDQCGSYGVVASKLLLLNAWEPLGMSVLPHVLSLTRCLSCDGRGRVSNGCTADWVSATAATLHTQWSTMAAQWRATEPLFSQNCSPVLSGFVPILYNSFTAMDESLTSLIACDDSAVRQ